MSNIATYTVEQFAAQAFGDALGIARRGRDLAEVAFAQPDVPAYLTSLFKAFRVPYNTAKNAGIKADQDNWSKAWHATTASLIAPFKARGFKITQWPNLRSGDGTVTIKTVAEAADDAKAKALADAERDAKDKQAFDAQQAELMLEKARSMSLSDLTNVILASIANTSHSVADVMAELGKHTAPASVRSPTKGKKDAATVAHAAAHVA